MQFRRFRPSPDVNSDRDAPLHSALGHRADLEGLRAVAILLVVASHYRVPYLAGGFVGVDVFFVLSGWLITALLVREVETTGRIALLPFFARRLRRLLPGLLLMLAATAALAAQLLPAAAQPEQAKAAASAAVWLSNIRFATTAQDYFAAGNGRSLYLHTWSLGVEEQFYLVWPLLLLAAAALARRRGRAPRGTLLATLGWVFAASLCACVALSRSQPTLAFYLMPARAWQFALGGGVFLLDAIAPARLRDAIARAGAACGIFLMLLAAVWLGPGATYPGFWALAPSAGAALVLAASRPQPPGAGRLLAARPMQALGRVSYAWYLWHWPVLLLASAVWTVDGAGTRWMLAALSLALAAASTRWLEQPVRRNPRLASWPGRVVTGALALMLLANVSALRWHNAAHDTLQGPAQRRYAQAREDIASGCDDWYRSARVRLCAFGDVHAPRTALLFGDSMAIQWLPALRETFGQNPWRTLVITKSACPLVAVPLFYDRIGREYTECAKWRDDALEAIAALHPDVVLMSSADTYALDERQWTEGSAAVLRRLSAAAAAVAVIRATPQLGFDAPDCLAPRTPLARLLAADTRCVAPASSERGERVFAALRLAASPFPNVHLVDLTEAVCPRGECEAEHDGVIRFRDAQHLSATFARSLALPLREAVLRGATATDTP